MTRARITAMSAVANEAGVPHFSLSPMPFTSARVKWSVDMPQPVEIVGKVMYDHMKVHGVKTIGYVGYSDSYGDLWFNDLKAQTSAMGMSIVDDERFARPDIGGIDSRLEHLLRGRCSLDPLLHLLDAVGERVQLLRDSRAPSTSAPARTTSELSQSQRSTTTIEASAP